VALWLTNLYLKRLVHKGHVKVATIPKSPFRYLLTPRGIAEKPRLTYEYLQYSLTHYLDVRQRFQGMFTEMEKNGLKKVVIFGVGELAELAYLSLQETNLTLVGFVACKAGSTYFSLPWGTPDVFQQWDYDAILISELENVEETKSLIQNLGIQRDRAFSIV
jgi:hypothetical protein